MRDRSADKFQEGDITVFIFLLFFKYSLIFLQKNTQIFFIFHVK